MTGSDHKVERTVLFADIAGSTRLYERFGDAATKRLLSDCLDLMEGIVVQRKGRVARRIGDEVLCTFPSANDAALAAMQLQAKVSEGHAEGLFPTPMRIRVGFEHGLIIETPEALYGNVVHTAARVAALAKARQILFSGATLPRLTAVLRTFTRFVDRAVLKGQSGEQEIHELLWSVQSSTVGGKAPPAPERAKKVIGHVELEYGDAVVRADAGRPEVEIGRDLACDLRVAGDSVSHLHARVLWDRGAVAIEDVSRNGTWIEDASGGIRRVHHGRAPLAGEGVLRLGDHADPASCATVRFRCRPTPAP